MDNEKRIYTPRNIDQLDKLISESEETLTYVAGATDLMVQEKKWQRARALVNLTAVSGLNNLIEWRDQGVLIGAAVPMADLVFNAKMKDRFPIFVEACRQIGSVQIQNRATLGGNIANASPAGDTLPVLSVLDARLWVGPRKNRQFEINKLNEIMTDPGQTSLIDNRYIAFIYLPYPEPDDLFWYFRKVGQRYSMAISKVSLAVLSWQKMKTIQNIRITAGSVTPQIVCALKTENLLKGKVLDKRAVKKAREQLEAEINPISDIRSTSTYRQSTCGALLTEALYLSMPNRSK